MEVSMQRPTGGGQRRCEVIRWVDRILFAALLMLLAGCGGAAPAAPGASSSEVPNSATEATTVPIPANFSASLNTMTSGFASATVDVLVKKVEIAQRLPANGSDSGNPANEGLWLLVTLQFTNKGSAAALLPGSLLVFSEQSAVDVDGPREVGESQRAAALKHPQALKQETLERGKSVTGIRFYEMDQEMPNRGLILQFSDTKLYLNSKGQDPTTIVPATPGKGKITSLVTASEVTASGRPITTATQFAAGIRYYIAYTATDMTVGDRLDLQFLVDGKPSGNPSTKIVRRDGTISGYWRFSGGKGTQQVSIYYNGATTPAQTTTFTVGYSPAPHDLAGTLPAPCLPDDGCQGKSGEPAERLGAVQPQPLYAIGRLERGCDVRLTRPHPLGDVGSLVGSWQRAIAGMRQGVYV